VRSIDLLKVAAEAAILRFRIVLARQGRRAAFGVVAVIFVLGVFVLAEVAGWQVLHLYVPPIPATLSLLGTNFLIAALFGVLAVRSSPGHAEREALRVRWQALDAARGALALTVAVPIASTLLRRRGGRRRSWFRLLGRRLTRSARRYARNAALAALAQTVQLGLPPWSRSPTGGRSGEVRFFGEIENSWATVERVRAGERVKANRRDASPWPGCAEPGSLPQYVTAFMLRQRGP
jgi:hypothetical protein